MKKPVLSLLMPVWNEGVNLKMTLNILKSVMELPHEVLIVYDTLDDDSIPIAREVKKGYPQVRLVHNKLGRGVSNAVISGVKNAKGKYVMILVADDIGPIFSIGRLMELMYKGYDFVSATRYSSGGRVFGGSAMGTLLSRTANKLMHHLAGAVLTDSTVGFKMFRRDVFDTLELEGKPIGWLIVFEMSIKAQVAGLRMGEVPIVSMNRLYGGESTFKLGPWTLGYLKLFLRGWGMLRGAKKLKDRG